jgi:murein DD-endopeptidase MepM/ murein hydrolase activator NlpD
VPHRAEARPAGRHRRDSRPRHRAPLPYLDPARALLQRSAIAGERHRTTLLTATLGAALVAGIAGGTAAAATSPQAPAAATNPQAPAATDPQVPAAATDPQAPAAATDPQAPAVVAAPDGVAADRPRNEPVAALASPDASPAFPARQGDLSAAPARRKARPEQTPREAGAAAWVHPNPAGQVTSCFGPRWGRQHAGVDLAAPHGSPIVAAGAGIVVRAGEAGGYGTAVLIDHGNGYLTHYGHLSAVAVAAGQRVSAGQQIGDEGSTGHSTGPHLHFEVHQGHFPNPVEPTAWMREHGVDIPGCAAG